MENKTQAQLLQDLQAKVGKELICEYDYLERDYRIRGRIEQVVTKDTNAGCYVIINNNGFRSIVNIPKDPLLEDPLLEDPLLEDPLLDYEGNSFAVYEVGNRQLTKQEKQEWRRVREASIKLWSIGIWNKIYDSDFGET